MCIRDRPHSVRLHLGYDLLLLGVVRMTALGAAEMMAVCVVSRGAATVALKEGGALGAAVMIAVCLAIIVAATVWYLCQRS